MSTRRIQEFLDGSGARYVMIRHSPACTAQETAQSIHMPGRNLAKTVIVWIDGCLAMTVVPATNEVDLELLRRQTGASSVILAMEEDFADRFADCQLGAVPPFGNLFGLQTYIDRDLLSREEIAFIAGTHTDVFVMKTQDYERLARPLRVRIAVEISGSEAFVMPKAGGQCSRF